MRKMEIVDETVLVMSRYGMSVLVYDITGPLEWSRVRLY